MRGSSSAVAHQFDPSPSHRVAGLVPLDGTGQPHPEWIKQSSPSGVTSDRPVVQRLPDLIRAQGQDRPTGLPEAKTAIIPVEAAELDDPTSLATEVLDESFITDFEHGKRKDLASVVHPGLVLPVEFDDSIRRARPPVGPRSELPGPAGDRSIQGMPTTVDDPRLGEQHRDQTEQAEAEREALAQRFDEHRGDTSQLRVTVLTTLQCNFACGYCVQGDHGEANAAGRRMSLDTAARVAGRFQTLEATALRLAVLLPLSVVIASH